mgnify:CR=1 FL=1
MLEQEVIPMIGNNRWRVLAIVSSALFLITIDMTVLYTALPRLTHDLAASSSEKLWIVNAYALVVAGLLPGLGTLGDRLGHKKMLLSGLLVFGAASLLAAFAPTAGRLIAARVLLGVGAAMMMPATLSVIRITFSDKSERALALGIWGAISAGGAALGPVVGGILLQYFWWGSVFLINIPVVIAAFIAGWLILPKDREKNDLPWSPTASILIMIGLVGITYAIKEASKPHMSALAAAASLLAGSAALVLFAKNQRASRHPLIDFSLFRDRTFSIGVFVALVTSLVMIGVELALSQRLQLVLGLAPLNAALTILPIPLASFIGGPLAGLALPRLGAKRLVTWTLLISGAGLATLFLTRDNGGIPAIIGMAAMRLGMGASMSAASAAIMGQASTRHAGMAASIEEVSFELGGAMGIAIFGSILTAVYSATLFLPEEFAGLTIAYDSLDSALLAAEHLSPETAWKLTVLARASFDKAYAVVLGAVP